MAYLMVFLFSLFVNVTVCRVVDVQKRIIGGHQCERQYHVRLRVTAPYGSSNLCGGSLITKNWILTAAHCIKPHATVFANLSLRPAQEVEIEAKPLVFADYGKSSKIRIHDIMLLQLPHTFDVQPIELLDCGSRPKTVEIAGHAATSGGLNDTRKPSKSPTLHCANIDVVDCESLRNTLREKYPAVYQLKKDQHWFCGQTPGVDTCYGDSGGGVVSDDKIYGVISFLGDPDFVCKQPVAFMDLCNPEYKAWIQKHIT